jgi:hypothetical protein
MDTIISPAPDARTKIMRYSGGYPAYREHCDAVAADGYRALSLT